MKVTMVASIASSLVNESIATGTKYREEQQKELDTLVEFEVNRANEYIKNHSIIWRFFHKWKLVTPEQLKYSTSRWYHGRLIDKSYIIINCSEIRRIIDNLYYSEEVMKKLKKLGRHLNLLSEVDANIGKISFDEEDLNCINWFK